MKLTKLQRYTAYCILYCEVNGYLGLCRAAWDNFGNTFSIEESLPELFNKKSGNYFSFGEMYENGRYWFKNNEERRSALKKCISETEPK